MSRPALPADVAANQSVTIRLTTADKARLDTLVERAREAAGVLGTASTTTVIRGLIEQASRAAPPSAPAPAPVAHPRGAKGAGRAAKAAPASRVPPASRVALGAEPTIDELRDALKVAKKKGFNRAHFIAACGSPEGSFGAFVNGKPLRDEYLEPLAKELQKLGLL